MTVGKHYDRKATLRTRGPPNPRPVANAPGDKTDLASHLERLPRTNHQRMVFSQCRHAGSLTECGATYLLPGWHWNPVMKWGRHIEMVARNNKLVLSVINQLPGLGRQAGPSVFVDSCLPEHPSDGSIESVPLAQISVIGTRTRKQGGGDYLTRAGPDISRDPLLKITSLTPTSLSQDKVLKGESAKARTVPEPISPKLSRHTLARDNSPQGAQVPERTVSDYECLSNFHTRAYSDDCPIWPAATK